MAWDDVLGHDAAKRLLQAHLAAGRVAPAYLLAGAEGIGKRRLALEMAKALNCTAEGARPCDQCRTCGQIARGTHPDVHQLGPGGASEQIRIEDVRGLLPRLALRPFSAAAQVVIVDGADRMTEEAGNSLLKSLEEPSGSVRFFLITSRPQHCLPTIRSRCQLVRCRLLPAETIQRLLVAQGCDAAAAEGAARLAGGSVAAGRKLVERSAARQRLEARLAAPPAAWLEHPLPETREEVAELLDGMTQRLRDIAVGAAGAGAAPPVDLDRSIETAFQLLALRESLEQFANPRLVASLAREHWLSLHG